jgi:endoglucanase
MTCDPRFRMPVDTVPDRLLLSVHYYTPWGYCGTESLDSWGTARDYEEQNSLLAMLTKFTDSGYGVVLGEWSVALRRDGTPKDNTYDFYENFLNNCDLYGYAPVLWDTNGMYSKSRLAIIDDGIARLLRERDARGELSAADIIDIADANIAWALRRAQNRPSTVVPSDTAIAWLMFNSGDWSLIYSVGDSYNPDEITGGITVTAPVIDGAGVYTAGLDFTGTGAGYADGIAFSALGISNGELLYPGWFVEVQEIRVNGEPYEPIGKPYTTRDDGVCTRVNLYNGWVTDVPGDARVLGGDRAGLSPAVVDGANIGRIRTLDVTFLYTAG